MDPRRGMNEHVSCGMSSRGCPASSLMHGGGCRMLSLCCDTQPCHTCNTLLRYTTPQEILVLDAHRRAD